MDSQPTWLASLRRMVSNAVPQDVMDTDPVRPTFGTVRQLSPLRIALDSDPTTTIPYSPPCLDYPTYVGQRVWVQAYGRRLVVVGVSKSEPDYVSGSNENGSYIRYASGVLECWMTITVTGQTIANAYGPVWQGTRLWTYPMPFVGLPHVECSLFKYSSGASFGTVSTIGSTQADLRGIDWFQRTDTAQTTQISAEAKGFWR